MARLLVVDDVKFISKMLKSIFEEKGHQVIVAADGLAAEETARREQPDLVLMDVMMPGMDGIEVTRRLKEDEKMNQIPIVIVSAKNDSQSIAAAYAAGADHYVVKPFNTEELLDRVAALVGESRMNFSCETVDQIPVVTVLLDEIDDDAGEQLKQSLEAAQQKGSLPVVLDLTRVKKIGPAVGDIAEQCHAQLAEFGVGLYVVLPHMGIGVKSLANRLGVVLRVHEVLEEAMAEARLQCPEAPATPETSAGTPAPPPTTATIKDPRRGVTLETREDAAHLIAQRQELGDDFFEFVTEVLPDLTADLHIDLREVKQVSSVDVWEFTALLEKLGRKQRKLLLLSAAPSVVETLTRGGLGEIVVADSDLSVQGRAVASPPTTTSS